MRLDVLDVGSNTGASNPLAVDSVGICPWALREGLILRKLDSKADGTALVETFVRNVGREFARARGNTR